MSGTSSGCRRTDSWSHIAARCLIASRDNEAVVGRRTDSPVARSITPSSSSTRKRSATSGTRATRAAEVQENGRTKTRRDRRTARRAVRKARRIFVYDRRRMLRFLTAGESHGRSLVVILEGLPAGLCVDVDAIARDLRRRQGGYGRGRRMAIESDRADIVAGVRAGETLGSPVAMVIANRDWPNWQ